MLAPNKHTNIKYSVLYISGLIMFEIQRSGTIKYDDLKNAVINQVGNELGDTFEYSLSFLYLINKIMYNQQSDTVINTI
jgi:hypothetical protein